MYKFNTLIAWYLSSMLRFLKFKLLQIFVWKNCINWNKQWFKDIKNEVEFFDFVFFPVLAKNTIFILVVYFFLPYVEKKLLKGKPVVHILVQCVWQLTFNLLISKLQCSKSHNTRDKVEGGMLSELSSGVLLFLPRSSSA